MNFQSIEYIITTAQEHNISKATDKPHISQQTLSAHIASVEEELGCKRFGKDAKAVCSLRYTRK